MVQDFLAILPAIKKRDPSNDGAILVRTIIACAVAADSVMTKEEVDIIRAVLKAVGIKAPITKKGILDLVTQYSGPTAYTTVQALSSTLTDEEKRHLVSAVVGIGAADGKISDHEAGFVYSLIEGKSIIDLS